MPMRFHLVGLPEVILQSFLLALLSHYWVNHPDTKWSNWAFVIFFALIVVMSTLGKLSAFGFLPQAP